MRWQGRRQSDNIEDRRSAGGRIPGGSAGGPRIPLPRARQDWLWSSSWWWPVFTALT